MTEIFLCGLLQRRTAIKALEAVPLDGTMVCIIQKKKTQRKPVQNALMWSDGLIASIAEQAWVDKKQFSSTAWHEYFKRKFLPEGCEDQFERMVRKGYRKWEDGPEGRELIGSTKDLTVYGMACYINLIEHYAHMELGVRLPEKKTA